MRIEILKTGEPDPDIEPIVGSYPQMIRTALGDGYAYHEVDVLRGELPLSTAERAAYIITGSAWSAYSDDSWVVRLREWLQALDPATPLVGFCFGHQIMAQAYGAVVEKARQGWAMGLHEYEVRVHESWMDGATSFLLPVSHRDQVVSVPTAARVIASSDFCPFAALSYIDRRAVSFQGHPEFSLEYTAMLIDRRLQKGLIGTTYAERAKASMRRSDDRARVIGWIRRFLDGSASDVMRHSRHRDDGTEIA